MMLLVDDKTHRVIHRGDLVTTFRGEKCRVLDFIAPHKPSSGGFVVVLYAGDKHVYYPSVIGARFVNFKYPAPWE